MPYSSDRPRKDKARKRILIVEDLATLSIAYADQVERAGYEAVVRSTAAEALALLSREGGIAALLLDLQLPDADGLVLLAENAELLTSLPVIVVTSDGSLSRAVDAMRLGAFDYLVKPVSGERLVAAIDAAVAAGGARPAGSAAGRFGDGESAFLGTSPQMLDIRRQIAAVAGSRATVFITGETGTGKEVCAEAIHRASGRNGRFVAINCGAIPEALLESELFGHVRGAFTGALADREGAVQQADKGTLFLDEIGEMALSLQVKLLRFLQTGTIQKVGSSRSDKVDVRVLCATNRDPRREVAEGRFREDLYYRLAVIPLEMPPLRARDGDVRMLAEAFLERFSGEVGKQFHALDERHFAILEAWDWPGNVRELQNVLLRAVLLNDGPDLPPAVLTGYLQRHRGSGNGLGVGVEAAPNPDGTSPVSLDLIAALSGRTMEEIERIAIDAAVDAAGGNIPAAARALGISAATLYRRRPRR